MAGNGALDLSIRIMGKVDPSLVTAIKQTKGLTGDLASALTGTKSLGSTVANTLGVIGKTGLGIMATLTTASAVMIKKTTSMAENRMAAGGFAPVNTHRNYLYCCIIASMGTGYPVDFFAGLPLCEAVKLRDAVNSDFFE